jgi:hypothetical protein
MSPITAELKCPHGRGETFIESEAVTEVASHQDGKWNLGVAPSKFDFNLSN